MDHLITYEATNSTRLLRFILRPAVFAYFLFNIFLFNPNVCHGIYHLLGIDVIPRDGEISFCIEPDYSNTWIGEPYVATFWQGNLYFLSFVNSNILVTSYDSSKEVPIFCPHGQGKCCFGPFPLKALNGIQLFAGVGTSINDVLASGRYGCFYSSMPDISEEKSKWTLMIYMIGSSLEDRTFRLASRDIEEMIKGSTFLTRGDVNIVLCTGGANRTGWRTVKYSLVRNGQLYVIKDLGNMIMTDPDILSNFVFWTKTDFPAEHYGLILWDHGGGANGYGFYSLEDGTRYKMDLSSLYQAFQAITTMLSRKLDILAYDACLMGSIEVAEVTSECAELMGASVELEPYHGLDYSYLFSLIAGYYEKVADTESLVAKDLGKMIAQSYIKQAQEEGTYYNQPIIYAIYDLGDLPRFNSSFNIFCKNFYAEMEKGTYLHYDGVSKGIIKTVAYPVNQKREFGDFSDSNIPVDLAGLLDSLAKRIPSLNKYVPGVKDSLSDFVLTRYDNIESLFGLISGGISVNIGLGGSYISILPEPFIFLRKAISKYIERKETDNFVPNGSLEIPDCPEGMFCAPVPTWLILNKEDVLGVDALFGKVEEIGFIRISLIAPIFRYGDENSALEFRLSDELCAGYQICNCDECSELTFTLKYGNTLVAEAYVNGVKSSLIMNRNDLGNGPILVANEKEGLWGKTTDIEPGDVIEPISLCFMDGTLVERVESPITINKNGTVEIRRTTLPVDPSIIVSFYSLNGKRKFEELCRLDDCAYCGVSLRE